MKKNPYPGKFIVFDGLDGSGLSTQSDLLTKYVNSRTGVLSSKYRGAWNTKEPTKSLVGGLINARLDGHWSTSPSCLQLLFASDRAFHLEKEIIPLLKDGVVVICDRYFFSSLAFGPLGGLDYDWLVDIQNDFILPDITFFLKVSPSVCLSRITASRFDAALFEKEHSLSMAWSNFEKIDQEFENTHIIDGERPIEDIHNEIKKITNKLWR